MEKMISLYSDEESRKAFMQEVKAIGDDETCRIIMDRHGISITANYGKLNAENKRRQEAANRRTARKFWRCKARIGKRR